MTRGKKDQKNSTEKLPLVKNQKLKKAKKKLTDCITLKNVVEEKSKPKASKDFSPSDDEIDIFAPINNKDFDYIDGDDDIDKLNESTHSLSLNENLLTNITVLNRPIQSQNKQKEKTSSSESSSEEDERYQVFKDTFIYLMKKKLPESALMLDIRTLKQIYSIEMEQIEDCLKKIVNYREDVYIAY
ncbi:unnamed protein product [Brachionus calyciflorus]|uniref:Uncharacterized protein n=1 Tax=Brachionus calyciflorus TaxID=104777 RepID=A0A813PJP3_9BILA|nr:unnamed protein product [Brachionus calyciflorus]